MPNDWPIAEYIAIECLLEARGELARIVLADIAKEIAAEIAAERELSRLTSAA